MKKCIMVYPLVFFYIICNLKMIAEAKTISVEYVSFQSEAREALGIINAYREENVPEASPLIFDYCNEAIGIEYAINSFFYDERMAELLRCKREMSRYHEPDKCFTDDPVTIVIRSAWVSRPRSAEDIAQSCIETMGGDILDPDTKTIAIICVGSYESVWWSFIACNYLQREDSPYISQTEVLEKVFTRSFEIDEKDIRAESVYIPDSQTKSFFCNTDYSLSEQIKLRYNINGHFWVSSADEVFFTPNTPNIQIKEGMFSLKEGDKAKLGYTCPFGKTGELEIDISHKEWHKVEIQAATCVSRGRMNEVCDNCNWTIFSYETPIPYDQYGRMIHTFDDGVITEEPNCKEQGKKKYTCTVCGHERTEYIPIDKENPAHCWSVKDSKEATCKSIGWVSYVCSVCGYPKSDSDIIPKLTTHTWDNGVITIPATTSKGGIKTFTCTVCGETKTETIGKVSQDTGNSRGLIEAFVARMFTKALGRDYDANGLKYWSDRLETHVDDGANVAYGFFNSNEFLKKDMDNATYINILYATFFGREADNAGYNYWNGELNKGTSRNKVLCGFIASNEFKKLCTDAGINRGFTLDDGTVANAGIYNFVERMYTKCLGRDGEENGMNWWTMQIAEKEQTAVDAAKNFFGSKEFIDKKLSEEEYIKSLYRTFMDREADNSGLAYWKGEMFSGMTRDQVLDGFAASNEFKSILLGFGL